MWRLLRYLGRGCLFLLETLGFNALMDSFYQENDYHRSSSGNIYQEQPSYSENNSYRWNIYNEEYKKEIIEFFSDFIISEESLKVSEIDTLFVGSFNQNTATLKIKNVKPSKSKDTLFFSHALTYVDSIVGLKMSTGHGFIADDKNYVELVDERTNEIKVGYIYKVLNEKKNTNYIYFLFQEEELEFEFLRIFDAKKKDE